MSYYTVDVWKCLYVSHISFLNLSALTLLPHISILIKLAELTYCVMSLSKLAVGIELEQT